MTFTNDVRDHECASTYRLDQRQNVHTLHAYITANPQLLHCTNLGCPNLATRVCEGLTTLRTHSEAFK